MPKEVISESTSKQAVVLDESKIFLNGGIDQTDHGVDLNKLVDQYDFLREATELNPSLPPGERVSEERLSSINDQIKELGEEIGVSTDEESLGSISVQYKEIVRGRMPRLGEIWKANLNNSQK